MISAIGDATRFIRRTSYYPGADAAANDDLDFDSNTIPMVFDSLNTLASCPWRVNTPVGLIHIIIGFRCATFPIRSLFVVFRF